MLNRPAVKLPGCSLKEGSQMLQIMAGNVTDWMTG